MLRCKQKWRRESKQGRVIFGSLPPPHPTCKQTDAPKKAALLCVLNTKAALAKLLLLPSPQRF